MFNDSATVFGSYGGQSLWSDALSGLSPAGTASADGDVPRCSCPLCSGQESAFSEGDPLPDAPTSGLPPSLDLSQIITQLRTSWGGSYEDNTYPLNGNSISYAILTSYPNDSSSENSGWQAMTGLMVARATEAFEAWDDLVAFTFTPYSGNPPAGAAVIQFGYSSATQNGGTYEFPELGNYRGTNEFGGDAWDITRAEIWLNSSWTTHSTSSAINQSGFGYYGGYGLITYLHEIGHALGLSHPGSYNAGSGTPTYQNSAEYLEDTRRYSIMSYWNANEDGSGTGHWGSDGALKYAQTPMVHDIAAVQLIYGADATTRTGNTTYGFNSTAGKDVYDFTKNLNPILSIYDASGTDTLDLSGFSGTQRIDLTPGAYSDVGGYMTNNLGIAYTATIENAIGGTGADSIVGNSIANVLRGGSGNDSLRGMEGNDTLYGDAGSDTLIGGNGTDTAVFTGNFLQYTIRWNGSAYAITDKRGGTPDGVDTASQMETYQFADRTATSITHDTGTGWLTSAKGSSWGMFWDPGNVQGWSNYTESYNGNGQRLTQEGNYDNGSTWKNFWDAENVQIWSSYGEHWNANGAQANQLGTYDTGAQWKNFWDAASDQNWSFYSEHWLANGNQANQIGTYDTGARWTNNWDADNSQIWSYFSEYYNTAGVQANEIGTYDTGARWTNNWDADNNQIWSYYSEYFNTSQIQANQIGIYDSGARWSNNWDADNDQVWSYYSEYFLANGNKANQLGVYDSGAQWKNYWDADSSQAWQFYSEHWNSAGQIVNRMTTWDDGSTTTEYGPGGGAPMIESEAPPPPLENIPAPIENTTLGLHENDWLI